ncbi:putative ribonuclease H-like domain-containing protein [Tanacetum coccineum]
MDDPNITMEEYFRIEEEKARRRGKVYNWETTTYGKIWYNKDVHNLKSVETEFPVIVFNDALTSEVELSCEPMVSPLNNNQIDFRISFDESDDEDYTVIYNKNSFSYKIISVNDLKTDSENDNYKVNMPSFPSFEPTVSYFDDFDYFKDFENEFPAIAYNDALTSKLDFSEPTVSPQHIDKFDETSLSECDGEEQNVIYFNDLFPFNVIYPDYLKLDKDNDDDDKIDIKQFSKDNVINTDVGAYVQVSNKLLETSHDTISKILTAKFFIKEEPSEDDVGELAHTKLTVELADTSVKHPKGIAENVLVRIGKFVYLVDFVILDMPVDVKVPLILRRPFLSTAHAKIDLFKRNITLRVGDVKIVFKSVKPASSLIKMVYMLSLRERMELDLEAANGRDFDIE